MKPVGLTKSHFDLLLDKKKWLNDEIINQYLNLLQFLAKDVYTFHSYFYSQLVEHGYDRVKKYTHKKGKNVRFSFFLRTPLTFFF
jgi:Ulp1 family protease